MSVSNPMPSGMSKAGQALWRRVSSRYALRPDEAVVLEDACRTTDMIAALDAAWADDSRPMTARGSMGQLVIHPLIGELRTQRLARDAMLARLKLPDDEAADASVNQQRAAASTKWAVGRGRGA